MCATVTLRFAVTSAAALLIVQCTPVPAHDVDAGALSAFAQQLLGNRGSTTTLPDTDRGMDGGVWLLRPPAEIARCGAAIVSVTPCDCDEGRRGCASCGEVHECAGVIIAGMREQGIRPGRSDLIRIDAFAPSTADGSGDPKSATGMRLRFEQLVSDASGDPTTYKAHVVLVPANKGTKVAMLITADHGESYECFDAANLVFLPLAEARCE